MARVTDADVEELVEVDSDISLTPFIAAANELVTELCVPQSYSATRLAMIEAWLSAHFYQIRDQAVAKEKVSSLDTTYQYKVDLNLAQTKYGQMAMVLDTAGKLQQLSKGKSRTVGVTWLGTDYNTDTDE